MRTAGLLALLLLAAPFLAPLRTLLSLVPLSPLALLFLFGVGLVNLATIEVGKWLFFRNGLKILNKS